MLNNVAGSAFPDSLKKLGVTISGSVLPKMQLLMNRLLSSRATSRAIEYATFGAISRAIFGASSRTVAIRSVRVSA